MKKSTFIILIAALLVMGTGCTKFDEDLNINPNLPAKASNSQLLTLCYQPAAYLYRRHFGHPVCAALGGKALYRCIPLPHRQLRFLWDLFRAIDEPEDDPRYQRFNITEGSKENQLAVARILRAWFYWHATDRWGDIPYNDALLGRENFTPSYTSQKDIYYDLLKELKEAAAQINEDDNPVKGDILYNGDMGLWKKFANSMRLLMALRLSKIDEPKGKAEFADAAAGELDRE